MEKNRLFTWIWRINNVAVLIALLAFFYLFYKNEIKRNNYHEPREIITSVAEDPKGLEKWVLRETNDVSSSEYTVLSLVSEHNEIKMAHQVDYRYKPYYGNTAKNVLFVNTKENSSSWLFKGNNQLILRYRSHIDRNLYGYKEKEISPQAIYYEVVDHDTNGDNIITNADNPNFAVSDMSGKHYKVILKEIEKIISMKMIDRDTLHLVYQKEAKGYSMKLDIRRLKVLSDEVLPKVTLL